MKEEEFIKELDEQRNASVETEKQNKFDLDLIIDSIKVCSYLLIYLYTLYSIFILYTSIAGLPGRSESIK